MKTLNIVLSFVFIIAAVCTANAQKASIVSLQKENIKVWGECGMCKKKIEKAALTAGAETASWNEDNKLLAVTYKAGKSNATKIQDAVAAVGYDTKYVTASTAAYNSLPACCHYERKETAKQAALNCCDNGMDCSKEAGCCKEGKCDKNNSTCKDMTTCKEKVCCKS